MTKICIVLAILCSTAVNMENLDVSTKNRTTTEQDTYSTKPMETQPLPTDPVKICEQKCDNYCVECKEPVRCGAGQKNCGKKPINPLMSQCSPDDICVPEDCECQ